MVGQTVDENQYRLTQNLELRRPHLRQPTIAEGFARARKKARKARWDKGKRAYNAARRLVARFIRSDVMLSGWQLQKTRRGIAFCDNPEIQAVKAYDLQTLRLVGECGLENNELISIGVWGGYQGQGIGSKMIDIANKSSGGRLVTYGGYGGMTRYTLTREGMSLIRSCLRRGILNHDQLILSTPPPSPSYAIYAGR